MKKRKRFNNFEYFKSEKDKQWYFNLLNKKDDSVLLKSEGYKSKRGKNVGIDSVRVNSVNRENFAIKAALDARWYFILKAMNRKIIGTSLMLESVEECEEKIKLVMKYGY